MKISIFRNFLILNFFRKQKKFLSCTTIHGSNYDWVFSNFEFYRFLLFQNLLNDEKGTIFAVFSSDTFDDFFIELIKHFCLFMACSKLLPTQTVFRHITFEINWSFLSHWFSFVFRLILYSGTIFQKNSMGINFPCFSSSEDDLLKLSNLFLSWNHLIVFLFN